jgi:hypothetical protein
MKCFTKDSTNIESAYWASKIQTIIVNQLVTKGVLNIKEAVLYIDRLPAEVQDSLLKKQLGGMLVQLEAIRVDLSNRVKALDVQGGSNAR